MKKTIIAVAFAVCIATSSFATVGSFLKDAADTTNQVSNAINGPSKVTVTDLKNSGTQYVNKTVQIDGSVIGLTNNNGKYTIVLSDGSANIACTSTECPKATLDSKITVVGTFNGKEVAVTKVKTGGKLF